MPADLDRPRPSTHAEDPRQQWRRLVLLIEDADQLFERAKSDGVSTREIELWQAAAAQVKKEYG